MDLQVRNVKFLGLNVCMGCCFSKSSHLGREAAEICNNTANHTFKRLLNRHLISIECPEGTNETEYIMSLAARANEIQHRA